MRGMNLRDLKFHYHRENTMSRQNMNQVHSVTKPEFRDDERWEIIVKYHNGVDDKIVRDTRAEIDAEYDSWKMRIVCF